jgi:tRNA nucleotidyltransferase/poly(A) polymerase
MRFSINSELESLLGTVRGVIDPEQDLFIVGGAVRDLLLERKLHDLDFAMPDDPTHLAKQVARRLDAGFFVLDDERHTSRVVFQIPEDDFFPLDFVQFTGDSLEEDLRHRDFTINAMALSIRDLTEVIDPLDGQKDLKQGQIRHCSEDSLLDDPVRVLRGVRLAMQFGFDYALGLDDLMREAASQLPKTSYERQRDEFFRILEGPKPGKGLGHCQRFQVFDTMIPPLIEQMGIPASPPHTLSLMEHTFAAVDHYHGLVYQLDPEISEQEDMPWWLAQVLAGLKVYSKEIHNYFSEEITPGRSKHGLAMLGTLLHDIGKPLTLKIGEDDRLHYYGHDRIGAELAWEAARRLQLSNAEAEWIRTLVRYHMHLLPLVNSNDLPDRKAIYRFFEKTGEVGVAIAMLSLADTAATYGQNLSQALWQKAVTVTKIVMKAWWEEREYVVAPQPLLDGNDLQKEFGLTPGKMIGRMLSDLKEAQASGEVLTKEAARSFISNKLSNRKK